MTTGVLVVACDSFMGLWG